MGKYSAALTLLVALSSIVWAISIDEVGLRAQPDGTTFEAHVFGDEFAGHQRTADGYEFVYGSRIPLRCGPSTNTATGPLQAPDVGYYL